MGLCFCMHAADPMIEPFADCLCVWRASCSLNVCCEISVFVAMTSPLHSANSPNLLISGVVRRIPSLSQISSWLSHSNLLWCVFVIRWWQSEHPSLRSLLWTDFAPLCTLWFSLVNAPLRFSSLARSVRNLSLFPLAIFQRLHPRARLGELFRLILVFLF